MITGKVLSELLPNGKKNGKFWTQKAMTWTNDSTDGVTHRLDKTEISLK